MFNAKNCLFIRLLPFRVARKCERRRDHGCNRGQADHPQAQLHFIAATLALLLIRSTLMAQMQHQTLDLALPTDNDALFSGGGPAFYQYIERNSKGVKSTPWEGGQYGFVRDPGETSAGIFY